MSVNRPRRRFQAFTVVEMLVVIAVISILVGLLLPALGGVKRRGAKTTEINNLRQVGYAWQIYGTNNNDAALPGFLDVDVQAAPVPGVSLGWRVMYEYPTDRSAIPPAPIPPATTYGGANIAGPWPWRLLSYLDYNHQVVHGYVDETDESIFELVSEAQEIAEAPAFGYNGLYIGGHWKMVNMSGVQTPLMKYYNHCSADAANPLRLSIPTTIGQISNSSKMVNFCSATSSDHLEPGLGMYRFSKLRANLEGSFFACPPIVGDEPQWQYDPQEPNTSFSLLSAGTVHVPLGRHTGAIAVLWADGHCDSQSLNAVADQRQWINNANARDFMHVQCP